MSLRRRACWALVCLALAAGCAAPPEEQHTYALVYGVSRYVDTRGEGVWPNLAYSDDDALAMDELLRGNGYTVTVRTDEEATRAAIESDVADLRETVGERDLVLLYFSGHGGGLGILGLDPQAAPLYPVDAQWIFPHDAIDPAFSGDTLGPGDVSLDRALYDGQVAELIAQLPCTRKVLIIDACNSGGFLEAGADVDALPPDYTRPFVVDRKLVFRLALRAYLDYSPEPKGSGVPASSGVLLAAAGAGEPSYEDSVLRQGVFTYFLLEAAREGDLDRDGYVTVLEAYAHVVGGIEASWNAVFGALLPAYQFLPRVSGGAADLVLFELP